MDWLQTVMLALVQGLTEFLPVSSSAHLILAPRLLGWPDQGQAFDVAVHVGTLVAVVTYFQSELRTMLRDWLTSLARREVVGQSTLAWGVIWGTIPAVVAGASLSGPIEVYLRSPLVIAATTILFGIVLWWASVRANGTRSELSISWRDAVIIGVAQAVALIPGTSRSGITITAGLFLGLTAKASARFSFLLSVPIITGAGVLHIIGLVQQGAQANWGEMAVGAVVAAASAFACIHVFLLLLERVGMMPFILYRLVLGGALIFLFW